MLPLRLRPPFLPSLALLIAAFVAPHASAGRDTPDPAAVGPWAVGHAQFEAVDRSRADRTLAVDVWYPVDAEDAVGEPAFYELLTIILTFGITSEVAIAEAPITDRHFLPLVVFSHGSGGINIQSISLMEALASHGFFVASPTHTGNSTFDGPDDVPFEDAATDRPKDVSFLIDLLLERSADSVDPFYQSISSVAIGVTGHSFGGFTALAMAAGYEASAFGAVPPDPRVRAILPISGTSGTFSDDELRAVRVPVLFLGGTLDTSVPIDPNATRPFDLVSSRAVYRADVIDATHTHFANICDIAQVLIDIGIGPLSWPNVGAAALIEPYEQTCIPPALPLATAVRLEILYSVAFFRRHLLHDLRYAPFLTETHTREQEPDAEFFVPERRPCGRGADARRARPPACR